LQYYPAPTPPTAKHLQRISCMNPHRRGVVWNVPPSSTIPTQFKLNILYFSWTAYQLRDIESPRYGWKEIFHLLRPCDIFTFTLLPLLRSKLLSPRCVSSLAPITHLYLNLDKIRIECFESFHTDITSPLARHRIHHYQSNFYRLGPLPASLRFIYKLTLLIGSTLRLVAWSCDSSHLFVSDYS
jgi:hypothetical protein